MGREFTCANEERDDFGQAQIRTQKIHKKNLSHENKRHKTILSDSFL
jgi:hypothetical protein